MLIFRASAVFFVPDRPAWAVDTFSNSVGTLKYFLRNQLYAIRWAYISFENSDVRQASAVFWMPFSLGGELCGHHSCGHEPALPEFSTTQPPESASVLSRVRSLFPTLPVGDILEFPLVLFSPFSISAASLPTPIRIREASLFSAFSHSHG